MSHSWQRQEQGTGRPEPSAPPPPRRAFLEWVIYTLGGLLAVVLGAPAIAYVLDPRNRRANAAGFRDVARFSELPVGEPREFVLRETVRDAWTLSPDQVVGRVFLIRRDGERVDAYTTTCPHLGCSINYTGSPQGIAFQCPCHNGKFNIDGTRVQPDNPVPRDMDALDTQRSPADRDVVQVRFQTFINNQAEKIIRG